MSKTLLDCGNCSPDFNAIRQMATSHFGATVIQSQGIEDTMEVLKRQKVDLVTVNRKLDHDYSDGLDVVRAIKSDPEVGSVPVMLVTNYEEHQKAAIEAGCEPGFGKLALRAEGTLQTLEPYLGAKSEAARENG